MDSSNSKKSTRRSLLPALIALVIAISASVFLSDALSTSSSAVAQSATTSPAATPTPKPTPQAAQDLKRNPPLDVTKLGDPMPRNLFVELSRLINPAVVSISTSQSQRLMGRRNLPRDPMREFFEDFWGLPPGGGGGGGGRPSPGRQPMAMGSGFIIRADGLIITNNHVIAQADVIKVQLSNNTKEEFDAKVIGGDTRTDIALIKIDAKRQLPVAPLGSSATVQVGEWVAAFGNPYGHAHTMTKGIVSAIGREISEINQFPFIQTDASINPGNSGGPLVNTQGFVIGVNTAIDARAQGIGFAIPIDNVKVIIEQLEKDGRVRRGFIGVGISPLTPDVSEQLGLKDDEGVIVNQVQPGSPAAKAGLQVYDIIVEFNGRKVASPGDLQNAVANTPIGQKAKARIIRFVNDKKTERTIDVSINESPSSEQASRNDKNQGRRFFGQKAPYNLGFNVADLSPQLRQDFGLPDGSDGALITEVEPNSVAGMVGLREGDLIRDVNGKPVKKATDVIRQLRQGRNILVIRRGGLDTVIAFQTQK